jgi:hypothetical protein
MPEGAVYVGRPTRWGNPLPGRLRDLTVEQLVRGYRDLVVLRRATIETPDYIVTLRATDCDIPIPTVEEVRAALAGRDLVCWCKPGVPCHGNVLLQIANSSPALKRVLHLYGLKRDRAEAEATRSHLVLSADRIVHHWRPWTNAVPREHEVLPPIPGSRAFKFLHLAVIGALIFVIGVVVYQAWLAGTVATP